MPDDLTEPSRSSLDQDDAVSILLCGIHTGLTDTLIVLHANPATQINTLISIPRDLYYKGRKINSFYVSYGMDYFLNELSELTQLDIDSYILVDMYAFIDVVNALGGIDLELERAIIDPTYIVKSHGKWGRMHFEKGLHHLNGVEALRLARSRHYSSDFDRAKRQQQILVAMKEKVEKQIKSDVTKLYDLIGILSRYVETNMNAIQMVDYFMRFREHTFNIQHVMDTSNVLYSTYSNLRYSKKSANEVSKDVDLGAYILLPRNNNWSLIPWYIREQASMEPEH